MLVIYPVFGTPLEFAMFINILYQGINFALTESDGIVAGAAENILPSLQALYDAGQYQVLPDPVPEPPQPDWLGLTIALEPYFNIGLAANYVVFTQCFNMLVALQRTANFDPNRVEWRNFAFNLNLGKAAFSAEPDGGERGEIEAIFSTFDIPFTFDAG